MQTIDGNTDTFMELSGRRPGGKPGEWNWTPEGFLDRLHTEYKIEDRNTGRYEFFGPLVERNPPQWRFLKMKLAAFKVGGKVRHIELKSRRVGLTSVITCLTYDMCRHIRGLRAGVLSHTDEGTAVIRRMLLGYYKRAPPNERPDLEAANVKEMVFGAASWDDIRTGKSDGIESSITSATARGFNPLSGDGMRIQQYSEMGKYKLNLARQEELWSSAYGTVAPGGPSNVDIESTAQGIGNMFHAKFIQAMQNVAGGRTALEGEFVPFFSGAHEDPSNRRVVERGFSWDDWPAGDKRTEERIRREIELPDMERFLRWRRWKIGDLTTSDFNAAVRRFKEDFPVFWEDAFMASHAGAVPAELMDETEHHVRTPLFYSSSLENADAPFGSDAIIWR